MKKMRLLHAYSLLAILFMAAVFVSCKKDISSAAASQEHSASAAQATSLAVAADIPGRTLAANCFQCHGTNGYASELKIAGMSYSEMISELNEFRAKDPKESIMSFHARAYTPEEISLIANFFSKQP